MQARQTLRRRQTHALRTLFRRVSFSNPFYAEKLRQTGLDSRTMTLEAFSERMPPTTRQEWTRDQLDHPPFGTNLTYPLNRYIRFSRTSGSTGTPMTWLDTRESWGAMLDNWAQVFKTAGVVELQRIFFAFSFGPFLGFWTAYESATRLGHLCIPAAGMSSEARLRLLMDTQAEVMCCTPTYAIRLAHVAEQEGIDLAAMNVRVIIVAGEPGGSIPATRNHISEHWKGARVFDHHGMTEVGPVTFECPLEPGVLHVIEDAYYTEIEHDELILTPLFRDGSPLFRYKTGDIVSAERRMPCACGAEGYCLLGGILGRKDDMAIIRGVNVFPSAVEEIIRSVPTVLEYRVELFTRNDLSEMRVLVETEKGAAVARDLERRFQRSLFLRIPVAAVAPGSLPRQEMKAKRWIRLPEAEGSES